MFSSCTYQDGKRITYYTGCNSIEAELDLERSVTLLRKRLESNDILIIHSQGSSYCGYKLSAGSKDKELKGAMTDYGLALEIEDFFDLKILDQ